MESDTEGNCCGCITLKRGSLIVGYLLLICYTLVLIICSFVTVDANRYSDEEEGANIIVEAIMSLNLVFTLLLIIGIHQNKRGLVKAYLIYTAIFLTILAIGVITIINDLNSIEVLQTMSFYSLLVCFYAVIAKYYNKMKDPGTVVCNEIATYQEKA